MLSVEGIFIFIRVDDDAATAVCAVCAVKTTEGRCQ